MCQGRHGRRWQQGQRLDGHMTATLKKQRVNRKCAQAPESQVLTSSSEAPPPKCPMTFSIAGDQVFKKHRSPWGHCIQSTVPPSQGSSAHCEAALLTSQHHAWQLQSVFHYSDSQATYFQKPFRNISPLNTYRTNDFRKGSQVFIYSFVSPALPCFALPEDSVGS